MTRGGVWLALVLTSCAASPPPAPVTLPAKLFRNTLVVSAHVGADTHDAVIDSGAPWMAFDPSAFRSLPPAPALGRITTVEIGPMSLVDQLYQTLSICQNLCQAIPAGALALRAFGPRSVTLDYRAPAIIAGGTKLAVTRERVVVGARLLSGSTAVPPVAPSRFVVIVTIEGTAFNALVDTGGSLTQIRQTRMDTLLADGRPSLEAETVSGLGASTGRITRCRSITVGRAVSREIPIEATPTMDAFMEGVSQETGLAIDAIVGGSFLRDFAVTFDFSNPELDLDRYATRDPLEDDFQRVGIAIRPLPGGSGYLVARLLPRTDAVGDRVASSSGFVGGVVVSIDGNDEANADFERVDRALRGPVGAAHTVVVETSDGRLLTSVLHVARVI